MSNRKIEMNTSPGVKDPKDDGMPPPIMTAFNNLNSSA